MLSHEFNEELTILWEPPVPVIPAIAVMKAKRFHHRYRGQ